MIAVRATEPLVYVAAHICIQLHTDIVYGIVITSIQILPIIKLCYPNRSYFPIIWPNYRSFSTILAMFFLGAPKNIKSVWPAIAPDVCLCFPSNFSLHFNVPRFQNIYISQIGYRSRVFITLQVSLNKTNLFYFFLSLEDGQIVLRDHYDLLDTIKSTHNDNCRLACCNGRYN